MAITVVLIVLSGALDFNTLFLLAAASFCVGIVFRECGIQIASGFCLASVFLGFLMAPNKLYCITFTAMSFYLLASEFGYDKLQATKNTKNKRTVLWLMKYMIFNIIYIPVIVLIPKLFYSGSINGSFLLVLILIGQVALLIYDMAYRYFQSNIWGKLRRNLKL